jgi:hypothetical protein
MKKTLLLSILTGTLLLFCYYAGAQTYVYKLSENFNGNVAEAPPLVQIPNDGGLTGEFVTRTVPATTCEEGGTAGGYFFEDDAGLQFNCPPDFIGESYSLSMIFQVDELINPPMWVRILSFTHVDDHGMYIRLTNPPTHGTLEFWPYGVAGTTDFFDTENFYQLILVRNDAGLIKVYVNGTEFAEYDDSGTQEYKFHDPENYLIFFRDHPSVLADEASPGFVSNIKLTNQPWNENQVAQEWEDFCASLLNTEELSEDEFRVYPNPANEVMNVILPSGKETAELKIYDVNGKMHLQQPMNARQASIDISDLPGGLYFLQVLLDDGQKVIKINKY